MSFVRGFHSLSLSFWLWCYLAQSRENGVPIEAHITQYHLRVHFRDNALGFLLLWTKWTCEKSSLNL